MDSIDSPYIRAKAYDLVESLDNLLGYLEEPKVQEVTQLIREAFKGIDDVLAHAPTQGIEPLEAYRLFVTKVGEYLPKEYASIADTPD